MAIANGSQRRIAYVPEVTWGVTPATPSFRTARITGGGPRTNKTTTVSNELQPDRNIRDELLLGLDVAGAYSFEAAYGSIDDILEAVMFGTWTSNTLKNGSTLRSFTFEETLNLGGSLVSVSRYPGARINTFDLSIASRQPVTGSFSLMAKQESLPGGILSGATYAAPGVTPISTASANVALLDFGGGLPSPKVRSLSLSLDNGMRVRPEVGLLTSDDFGFGDLSVTGSLEVYFDSDDLYALALAHGSLVVDFVVGNAAGQKYRFQMPNCRPMNPERRPGGNNDDVMAIIPFRALYSAADDCTINIRRAVT